MFKSLRRVIVMVFLLTSLISLPPVQAADDFEGEVVTVAVVGDESQELWEYIADKAKAEAGIELKLVMLTDYNLPNEALADGSVDLNAFQHDVFLENWNQEHDQDLVTLGYTVAFPIRLYSSKHQSVEDLPDKAQVVVNNAPTSEGYNLQTLERAGLIKLDDQGDLLPTPDHIVENPKNIEIVELEAPQIPAVLPDVDAAFIDNSFLSAADLTVDDAIYVYGDTAETLNLSRVNNIAARKEDQDNPLLLKIVELYQSEDVAKKIEEIFQGGAIPAWDLMEAAKEAQEAE